ncbi:hypothetical protein RHSIM_Rhsim12G0072900 [Rhododendron simsii]|uniref:Uncharacterized protein n=1 Tax=Rhododendron simsii TaxID=118357 RepID=A0A834G2G7_RHOSS|nr:hypothetical protein RHSIM_Rhsim12G0072900 [Rhododendron simsii]
MLSLQAEFPANTNILYVDLPSAELIASRKSETSLPGMVFNTKKPIVDQFGIQHQYVPRTFDGWLQSLCYIRKPSLVSNLFDFGYVNNFAAIPLVKGSINMLILLIDPESDTYSACLVICSLYWYVHLMIINCTRA